MADQASLMWLGMIFGYAVMAVFNGLLTVPCFWAVFAARDKPRAVVILVIYYALLGMATFVLIVAMAGGRFEPEMLLFFLAFGLSFLAVLAAGLGLLRAGPYVLRRPRRRPALARLGPDAGGASPFAGDSPPEGASPFAPLPHEE
jgi:hypothetical protein